MRSPHRSVGLTLCPACVTIETDHVAAPSASPRFLHSRVRTQLEVRVKSIQGSDVAVYQEEPGNDGPRSVSSMPSDIVQDHPMPGLCESVTGLIAGWASPTAFALLSAGCTRKTYHIYSK